MPEKEKKLEIGDVANDLLEYAKKNNKSSKTWIGVIASLGIVFLGLGVLYFQAWKQGKKLAKLEAEHDDNLQKAEMAKADADVAELERTKQEALQEAARHADAMKRVQAELDRLELEHAETSAKINSLDSWESIDSFLNGK